jgi:signal transduction histidine kinase
MQVIIQPALWRGSVMRAFQDKRLASWQLNCLLMLDTPRTPEFSRHSLARQFLVVSFPVVLLGMLAIGFWVASKIESSVAQRIGSVVAIYVDSFIAPHVQSLTGTQDLSAPEREALASLLRGTALGERIVAFKIWRPDGTVLHSNNPELVGRKFEVDEGLQAALAGGTHSEISELKDEENIFEAKKHARLIETYVPLHAMGKADVIAAAEVYHPTDELTRESRMAQTTSWLVVGGVTALTYLCLFGLVRRGSKTIDVQRQDLSEKVYQLTQVLQQNELLHERVRRAAARTTALNESFLRRLSADLHDGPGQDMGLAMMQLEALARRDLGQLSDSEFGMLEATKASPSNVAALAEYRSAYSAMRSALADLRAISSGLLLPEVSSLSPAQVAARAIRDYEQKTGAKVTLNAQEDSAEASLPVKITLYRVLQETLSNGFRHALGSAQHVRLVVKNSELELQVRDNGPGFDAVATVPEGHLGLAGMRERVEILGGSFDLQSSPGSGTTVLVQLPLYTPGTEEGLL